MKSIKINLILSFFLFFKATVAQTWVFIPDAHFVTYLQSIIPSVINGDSLNISSSLVNTTTHKINVESKGITNLSGIQYFTSLDTLNCSFNNLTSLPALPTTLTYLNCFHNHLSNLPTLWNGLTFLSCGDNYVLASIPTLPNSLLELECGDNHLTNLPALPNLLQVLICNNNPLISLPALPNSLTYIDCDTDSLTSLPTLPNSLLILGCGHNHLTSLPALPHSLTNLDCGTNLLTSLPALPDSITSLYCDSNNITCLPTFPSSLVDTNYFNINGNPYNCLPNYVGGMDAGYLATPLCATGNTHGCPVAVAGIEQVTNNTIQIMAYPNPASVSIFVSLNTDLRTTIKLINITGQTVYFNVIGKIDTIDLSNFAKGIYMLIVTEGTKTGYKKIIVE